MRGAGILLTGFAPFRQWRVNSSWEAVRRVGASDQGIVVACLPVDHRRAAEEIGGLIACHEPQIVLLTGLADRPVPCLETRARIGPDLDEHADPTRAGRWHFVRSLRAMQSTGISCRVSPDAGRYVCETTYWAALGTGAPSVALLHLPPVGPSWTPARLARAVEACLAPIA